MGTRGTITFIFKGKKIKIYNHFDSYPEGLGVDIVKELVVYLSNFSVDEIIKKFCNVTVYDEENHASDEAGETSEIIDFQNLKGGYAITKGQKNFITSILNAKPGTVGTCDEDQCCNYIVDFDSKMFYMSDTHIEYDFDKLDSFLDDFDHDRKKEKTHTKHPMAHALWL